MNLPKYEIIRQYVIDMMFRHQGADTPLMSEREMSRFFDTTRTTVRKALKALVDEAVLIPRHGSGLYINPNTWKNTFREAPQIKKILFLHSRAHSTFCDAWGMMVISALCSEFARTDAAVNLCSLTGEPGSELAEIQMYRPDAIVWLRPSPERLNLIAELRKKIPVCTLFGVESKEYFSVSVDYFKGGQRAAEWFASRKCSNVIFAGTPGDSEHDNPTDRFQTGWNDAWSRIVPGRPERLYLNRFQDFRSFFSSADLSQLDGIFCQSSVFYGLAREINGTRFADLPIMVDSDWYKMPEGIRIKPAAIIELYPSKVCKAAVKKLVAVLKKHSSDYGATIFDPVVK